MLPWMLLVVGLAGAGEVPEVHRVWVPSCGEGLGRGARGTVLGPSRSPWSLDPRTVRAINGMPVGSEGSWSRALDASAEDTRCTYDVALADPMVFDLVGEVPGPMDGDVVTRLQVLKWLLPHLGRHELDDILAVDLRRSPRLTPLMLTRTDPSDRVTSSGGGRGDQEAPLPDLSTLVPAPSPRGQPPASLQQRRLPARAAQTV